MFSHLRRFSDSNARKRTRQPRAEQDAAAARAAARRASTGQPGIRSSTAQFYLPFAHGFRPLPQHTPSLVFKLSLRCPKSFQRCELFVPLERKAIPPSRKVSALELWPFLAYLSLTPPWRCRSPPPLPKPAAPLAIPHPGHGCPELS